MLTILRLTEGNILCHQLKFLTIILAIFPFLPISNSTLTFVVYTYVRTYGALLNNFRTTQRVPLLFENVRRPRFG